MFYISSRGHSATLWLSNIINCHPKVKCYHGLTKDPEKINGKKLTPKEFAKVLENLEKKGGKNIGAIHGYYGASMLGEMRERKLPYLAIVRDPTKRLESLLAHSYYYYLTGSDTCKDNKIIWEAFNSISAKKISEIKNYFYTEMKKLDKMENKKSTLSKIKKKIIKFLKIYEYKKLKINYSSLNPKTIEGQVNIIEQSDSYMAADDICRSINDILISDRIEIKSIDNNDIIKMEKMTSEWKYLEEKVLSKLAPNDLDKDNFLNGFLSAKEIFNTPVNKHFGKSTDLSKNLYNKWPDFVYEYYCKALKKQCSDDQINLYSEYSYYLPI